MAENSKIEWTHHTFNPWIGCQKVGPGCDHCYAEARDIRFTGGNTWGPRAARKRTGSANWRKPLAWDRAAAAAGVRRRVFCASLADVFDNHDSIDPAWRLSLWALIRETPNLDWMLLTKRPGNIPKMIPLDWGYGWPNVWLGCTVVNQEEADRDIPKLLDVPARIHFLSMEPLLGPVNILDPQLGGQFCQAYCREFCKAVGDEECPRHVSTSINLVIVGGESGPGARPMHPDWARSLRDQCQAAGVAFHFKQWGEWIPAGPHLQEDRPEFLRLRAGDRGFAFHDGLEMGRAGKKAAGRDLDGRTWDEMPEVRHG